MAETQNIEFKQRWHDDYLKWICGFANARGGRIYIGKDDKGRVTGLDDPKSLMETLPNKIRDMLGIVCEINLETVNKRQYIEITVQPYSVPVSLRGRDYFRSGSSKMELTGNALNEFLLKKAGKTWDDVLEEGAALSDIDESSVKRFLAVTRESGRLPDVSGLSTIEILEKLRLMDRGKLKRGAIILFGKDPNRFYPNIVVKIGRFGSDDADLRYQESAEGNLIEFLQNVPEPNILFEWTHNGLKGLKSEMEYFGNKNIIKLYKTAFFCSRKCPADIVLKSLDWAKSKKDKGECVISCFHSRIEKDVFDRRIGAGKDIHSLTLNRPLSWDLRQTW